MPTEQPPNTAMLASYYKRLWSRFYQDVKRPWWENVGAIIIIIVGMAIQYMLGWIKTGRDWSSVFINISPYAGVLAVYLVLHAIRAPVELDKQQAQETTELQGRDEAQRGTLEQYAKDLNDINVEKQNLEEALVASQVEVEQLKTANSELEETLQPKFEILFGPEHPLEYPYTEQIGDSIFHRIGIKNIGGSTLYGVAVKMDGFTSGRVYHTLPLRARHAPRGQRFSLDAGEQAYIDVVVAMQDAKHQVVLRQSIFDNRHTIVYAGTYHLTFRATSSNAQPCDRKAVLTVDAYGRVFLRPDDDGQSAQNVGSIPSS